MKDILIHYGVKGMKWGVRKEYEGTGGGGGGGWGPNNPMSGNPLAAAAASIPNDPKGKKNVGKNAVKKMGLKETSVQTWSDEEGSYTTRKMEKTKGTYGGNQFVDDMASTEDYEGADKVFDQALSDYFINLESKGREYAMETLDKDLKNYKYELTENVETFEFGETYASGKLKVFGNKYIYNTFGEADYTDEQYFEKKSK